MINSLANVLRRRHDVTVPWQVADMKDAAAELRIAQLTRADEFAICLRSLGFRVRPYLQSFWETHDRLPPLQVSLSLPFHGSEICKFIVVFWPCSSAVSEFLYAGEQVG